MNVYEKYLISDNNIKNIKYIMDAVKLINDINIVLNKNIDDNKKNQHINSIMNDIDKLLRKLDTKSIYKEMIKCGVNAVLKNNNSFNRKSINTINTPTMYRKTNRYWNN